MKKFKSILKMVKWKDRKTDVSFYEDAIFEMLFMFFQTFPEKGLL